MAKTLKQIDDTIDSEIRFYHTNKPHYWQFIEESAKLPSGHRGGASSDNQAQFARACQAILGCYNDGTHNYLASHPTAVSELLAWVGGNSDKKDKKDYPDMTDSQGIILNELFRDWRANVQASLAEHIETFGREKITAAGINQAMKETLPNAVSKMLENLSGTWGDFMLGMKFLDLIEILQKISSDATCKAACTQLSDRFKKTFQLDKTELPALNAAAQTIADNLAIDEANITPRVVEVVKELVRDMRMQTSMDKDLQHAVVDLRSRYWDLAETPYYGTSNILNVPYRK